MWKMIFFNIRKFGKNDVIHETGLIPVVVVVFGSKNRVTQNFASFQV